MKIVFYIFIIIVLLVIIKNLGSAIVDNLQGKSIITSYKTTLSERKNQHAFLKEQLSYVKSNQFVEEEARNKLGLVHGSEVVVIAPQPEKKLISRTTSTPLPNWQIWLTLIK